MLQMRKCLSGEIKAATDEQTATRNSSASAATQKATNLPAIPLFINCLSDAAGGRRFSGQSGRTCSSQAGYKETNVWLVLALAESPNWWQKNSVDPDFCSTAAALYPTSLLVLTVTLVSRGEWEIIGGRLGSAGQHRWLPGTARLHSLSGTLGTKH